MQIFTLPVTSLGYNTIPRKQSIKYISITHIHITPKLLRKKNFFYIIFKPSRRMSEKNIKFREKKDIDINKILVSQKESYGKEKIHLNTLLDMTMMMSLDHYVKNVLK